MATRDLNRAEETFQQVVIEEAHALDLLAFHSTDPTRDIGRGFPDLVLAGPNGHLFAELKMWHGRMRPDQTSWAWKLRASGAPYTIWTPSDFSDIRTALRRMAA
jgi:hypothetical protein